MKPEKNFTISKDKRRVSILDALDAVSKISEGIPSAFCFEHGTMQVKMYRPAGQDPQKPHTRDEIYVIARGFEDTVRGGKRGIYLLGGGSKNFTRIYFANDYC